jgi:hypothetical protein
LRTVTDLKTSLHRSDLRQLDKLLLILSSFDRPCQIKELKSRARDAGLKITDSWSPSSTLRSSDGRAINTATGWELTNFGREHVNTLCPRAVSLTASQTRNDLRTELSAIKNADTRAFAEEAVQCFEYGLFRSAVLMSWLAAIHVLYDVVHSQRLIDFNKEASRIDAKWKAAKSIDDIGRMKERDFLDRVEAISIIGKNVKHELIDCLNLRNGCGHPNSLKLGPNTVAHHIEILLLNVFKVL